MASLKGLTEEFFDYLEKYDRLGEPSFATDKNISPTEIRELRSYCMARSASIQQKYDSLRAQALNTVRCSSGYNPGTIIVVNSESFTEDGDGNFIKVKTR